MQHFSTMQLFVLLKTPNQRLMIAGRDGKLKPLSCCTSTEKKQPPVFFYHSWHQEPSGIQHFALSLHTNGPRYNAKDRTGDDFTRAPVHQELERQRPSLRACPLIINGNDVSVQRENF